MSNSFYKLKVTQVKSETPDCVSVSFEIPDSLKETFSYSQGQYLTLKFSLNGKEERRAYSMSSSPIEKDITVSVKRLSGGLVSNHINDNVKAGMDIEVMAPEGRFFTKIDAEHKKSYYLVAAGSGITPMMSILKTVLEKEPMSTVFLLYGNRNEADIIFKAELDALEQRYNGQLIIEHILSGVKKSGGIASWFKKKPTNSWTGKIGRIDLKTLGNFIIDNPPRNKDKEYFICGPGEMIDSAKNILLTRGVEKNDIHVEYFTAVADPTNGDPSKGDPSKGELQFAQAQAQVKVKLEGKEHLITVPADKTILDALLDKKIDPPYSCTSGSCSTCMAKVVSGSAKMDVCYALDDDEIEDGYILTCQAHPTSANLEINYDV